MPDIVLVTPPAQHYDITLAAPGAVTRMLAADGAATSGGTAVLAMLEALTADGMASAGGSASLQILGLLAADGVAISGGSADLTIVSIAPVNPVKPSIWQGAGEHWLHEPKRRRKRTQNVEALLAIALASSTESLVAALAVGEKEKYD
jgi:hypothetical protein